MSEIIDFMLARQSEPRLGSPAPDHGTLKRLVECALRAPDHALLQPARYVVLEGEDLNRLGRYWRERVASVQPDADETILNKAQRLPTRAPMLVFGICRCQDHPRVPAIEQQISTGVGMGYLLLALQAEGYGAIWRTGDMAYSQGVQRWLGLAEDESIIGILYVGTPESRKESRPRPDVEQRLQFGPSGG